MPARIGDYAGEAQESSMIGFLLGTIHDTSVSPFGGGRVDPAGPARRDHGAGRRGLHRRWQAVAIDRVLEQLEEKTLRARGSERSSTPVASPMIRRGDQTRRQGVRVTIDPGCDQQCQRLRPATERSAGGNAELITPLSHLCGDRSAAAAATPASAVFAFNQVLAIGR
jgi:hypothetical protein